MIDLLFSQKKTMNCPKCDKSEKVNNGIVRDLQRYKCKNCGFNFTVYKRSNEYPKSIRGQSTKSKILYVKDKIY
ncbi:transposase-like zinc-binding domain-containing protein [Chryseobacterium sp. IT-36CA2]|uniref:transposase-like zinc-binding domain-containing protein n=1 Tax=Chryseobacterium sp. IT-36CA2 TaxID=3026460 RepID=UPI0039E1ADBF